MKKNISILIVSIFFFSKNFSQCPPAILKIFTPLCDSARNLRASDNSCSQINLSWKGNKGQNYIVQAFYSDSSNRKLFFEKKTDQACDDRGKCSINISANPNSIITWNVQSICDIRGKTFYSYTIEGNQFKTADCEPVESMIASNSAVDKSSPDFNIYPNPSTGLFNIKISKQLSKGASFQITDMNGKMIINRSFGINHNTFQIDLSNYASGIYILKILDGNEIHLAKLIKIKS